MRNVYKVNGMLIDLDQIVAVGDLVSDGRTYLHFHVHFSENCSQPLKIKDTAGLAKLRETVHDQFKKIYNKYKPEKYKLKDGERETLATRWKNDDKWQTGNTG